MNLKTFKHGIHPTYNKEFTSGKGIENCPVPKKVIIPLQQHIGRPCKPLVKKGDEVTEGQKIGDVEAFVSTPVHASITGKVTDIAPYPYPLGGMVQSIVIQRSEDISDKTSNDFNNKENSKLDISSLTSEDIRLAVHSAGIVGLGGAAFPTHVKLSPPENKEIDAIIINGCECEPYLTADDRLMVEHSEKILYGALAIMKAVNAGKIYIGIEANKKDALSLIKEKSAHFKEIQVVALQVKYPQGAEKMLIKAVLNRDVPLGGLPMDAGVVVQNVGTAFAAYNALQNKKPLTQRVVTVTGPGITEPKNLMVRIGTPFSDVIDVCGGIKEGNKKVIMGGPMMGIAQSRLDVPVIKGTSGILVLMESDTIRDFYKPCIRCAGCVDACPMKLIPYRLSDFGRFHMTEEFKEYGGMGCIECGCCSFTCPSNRPLVHWIRIGKLRLREAEKKSA